MSEIVRAVSRSAKGGRRWPQVVTVQTLFAVSIGSFS